MAHQAGILPWDVLASIFELRDTNFCQYNVKDFHPRDRPDNRKKLSDFIEAFLEKAFADARLERSKYPEKYEVPAEDEVIVTDEVVKRITPTVERWQSENDDPDLDEDSIPVKRPRRGQLCPHTNESDRCKCALPFKERKMSAFKRFHVSNNCFDVEPVNREVFSNLEVVKTLLLHGEMEPILRACAHESCALWAWWQTSCCNCGDQDLGWNELCIFAIEMYIILNLVYCFPETREQNGSPIDDYGDIKSYQHTIHACTRSEYACGISTYPHRDFFGIEKGQFSPFPEPYDRARWMHLEGKRNGHYFPCGLMSWDELFNFEKPMAYQPHKTDIPQVRWIICQKGLPVELADMILEAASYTPKRTLPVSGKPFHPQNRAELNRYLEQCWQLIVRCIMVGHELPRMNIEDLVRELVKCCFWGVFGCDGTCGLSFPRLLWFFER